MKDSIISVLDMYKNGEIGADSAEKLISALWDSPDAAQQEGSADGSGSAPDDLKLDWSDDGKLRVAAFVGKKLVKQEQVGKYFRSAKEFKVVLDGEAKDVICWMSLECRSGVLGSASSGGSMQVEGGVAGNAKSGGSMQVEGGVGGNANAGGGLSIGKEVGGSASCGGGLTIGGSVSRGDVKAGGGIRCGNVNGNVSTSGSITCGDIYGEVKGGTIQCKGFKYASGAAAPSAAADTASAGPASSDASNAADADVDVDVDVDPQCGVDVDTGADAGIKIDAKKINDIVNMALCRASNTLKNVNIPDSAPGAAAYTVKPDWDDDKLRVVAYRGARLLDKRELSKFANDSFKVVLDEALDVECWFNLECGSIDGGVNAGGHVTVSGDVGDGINAGGHVSVEGDVGDGFNCGGHGSVGGSVGDSVSAGGNVTVGGDVGDSVTAGANLTVDGNVDGDVSAGHDTKIDGDVSGDVSGTTVEIGGGVEGSINAEGDVTCGDVGGDIKANAVYMGKK